MISIELNYGSDEINTVTKGQIVYGQFIRRPNLYLGAKNAHQ